MEDVDLQYLFDNWDKMSPLLGAVLVLVIALLAICAVVSIVISIYLSISYIRYNRKQNSAGMTGAEIARYLLDNNGLLDIGVTATGSFLFGNSYSHYFKKVRLRRLTWKKESVSSLAMASQKSCLAILDRQNDPDTRTRVRLTPFIYFGPMFCIPLIVVGVILDALFFNYNGVVAVICILVGVVGYAVSFIMSLSVLKTEVKAQNLAYAELRRTNLATEDELQDLQKLFKLYNIEYVNNMIVALLELLLRVLSIFAKAQVAKNSSSKD